MEMTIDACANENHVKARHEDMIASNSALIDYALRGLQGCWMPEHGRWSHIYHLDGRAIANESRPHSDVFYTLNVLLGLSRVERVPNDIDVGEIFDKNVRRLLHLPVRTYAYGMALWAAAELGLEIPPTVANHTRGLLSQKQWAGFHAQDLGMLLSGIAAQSMAGRSEWRRYADDLFSFLKSQFHDRSGLFYDTSSGLRKRYGSFATQTYLTLACYHYGDLTGNKTAITMANACASKLIALQGPHGEWPWFLDAKIGLVVDFYEVYSVHQYGMAPAFLECAESHGISEARQALIKGFNWILGDNQLKESMLVPQLSMSIRSQVRRGEMETKMWRMLRAVRNTGMRRSSDWADPGDIKLRMECRSYELGWILWSFGQRKDLPQLTEHVAFANQG